MTMTTQDAYPTLEQDIAAEYEARLAPITIAEDAPTVGLTVIAATADGHGHGVAVYQHPDDATQFACVRYDERKNHFATPKRSNTTRLTANGLLNFGQWQSRAAALATYRYYR